MADGRYTGLGGSLVFVNESTDEPVLPAIDIESWNFEPLFEMVESDFISETSTRFRSFHKGFGLKLKTQPNQADQIVSFMALVKAKGEGAITDVISAGLNYTSSLGGDFRISCRDLEFESGPLDLGKRTQFLGIDLAFKGSIWKPVAQ